MVLVAACALAVPTRCRPGSGRPADLVLVRGNVVTLDPGRPRAQAIAVRGERIVAVGTDGDVAPLVGPSTRVIDLAGRLAVPGLVEGHAHFLSLGRSKRILELGGESSWDEVVAKVAAAARSAAPGAWIEGRGWHQERWSAPAEPSVEGFPTRAALDRAAPANPVWLRHASGHASIANGAALERSGLARSRGDPPGGRIVRDARGAPTGALVEAADDPVRRAIESERAALAPEEREAELRRDALRAQEECLSKGIVAFHDAGASFETIALLRKMALDGSLRLRLHVMIEEPDEEIAARAHELPIVGAAGGRLTVRAIKRYMDGALGSHGAWMLRPYADDPGTAGMSVEPIEKLEATARLAIEQGLQLCVHAIGDRANREVLDLYERVFRSRPGKKDPRWRIEHAQHVDPLDAGRFGRLGVIAAMQGIHCASDAPWVVARVGERRAREGAYAWRSLIASGATIVNGTDAPVEAVDPIACFAASVTRRARDGSLFFPEQRMTREEALRSYTANAAWAAFEEKDRGTLAPGKLADVTVLSEDILSVPDDRIPGARAVLTLVGGAVEYDALGAR